MPEEEELIFNVKWGRCPRCGVHDILVEVLACMHAIGLAIGIPIFLIMLTRLFM